MIPTVMMTPMIKNLKKKKTKKLIGLIKNKKKQLSWIEDKLYRIEIKKILKK